MKFRSGYSRLGIGLGLVSMIALAVALPLSPPQPAPPEALSDGEATQATEPSGIEPATALYVLAATNASVPAGAPAS